MWLPKKAARVLHTPEDLGMLNFFVNKNDKRTKDDVYIKQHVSALQKSGLRGTAPYCQIPLCSHKGWKWDVATKKGREGAAHPRGFGDA
jgi:hypothetical protein